MCRIAENDYFCAPKQSIMSNAITILNHEEDRRVVEAIKKADGVIFLCADHGNAEELIDYKTGEPWTAHTTNPVPFILINGPEGTGLMEGGRLCDIAPTLLELLGLAKPQEMTGHSLLKKLDE